MAVADNPAVDEEGSARRTRLCPAPASRRCPINSAHTGCPVFNRATGLRPVVLIVQPDHPGYPAQKAGSGTDARRGRSGNRAAPDVKR